MSSGLSSAPRVAPSPSRSTARSTPGSGRAQARAESEATAAREPHRTPSFFLRTVARSLGPGASLQGCATAQPRRVKIGRPRSAAALGAWVSGSTSGLRGSGMAPVVRFTRGEGPASVIDNLTVTGGLGDDTLRGGSGNDWLSGGNGNDDPPVAAKGMIARIDELTPDKSGHFFHASGQELPW